MVNVKQIILIVNCVGAFVFFAASCDGNEWYKFTVSGLLNKNVKSNRSIGLWKICIADSCSSYSKTTSNLRAERAFSLLAVLASVAATSLAIAVLFAKRIKRVFAPIILVTSILCMVIALGIFTDEYKDFSNSITLFNMTVGISDATFGWSYALGWVGCVLAIIGSIFGCIASREE